jgi:hypothetical protein
MAEESFRRRVFAVGRNLPAAALDLAVRHYTSQDYTAMAHVPGCVELAGLIASYTPAPDTPAAVASLPPSPTSTVLAAELLHTMAPWVAALRRWLTGSPVPPCETVEEALQWCCVQDTAHLLGGWYPVPGADPSATFASLLEHVYFTTTAHWEVLVVACGEEPALGRLAREAYGAARLSGFRPADVAVYVLTDLRPELPAGRLAVHSVHQPEAAYGVTQRRYVTLELSDPGLTFVELWTLWMQARRALQSGAVVKRFTAEDAAFLALVERLGGVPPRRWGKKAFWERVCLEWNARPAGGQQYASWRGPAGHYRRLRARLARLREGPDTATLAQRLGIDWEAVTRQEPPAE